MLKCVKYSILILLISLLCSCTQVDDRFNYVNGQKIIYPELPLIFLGDTIPEPVRKDLRFVSMIDGTCWTCLANYSALKEVFDQIQALGFGSSVSSLIYIEALDYQEVSAPLALFGFFYPVYIDRYCKIYSQNNLDGKIGSLLIDKDDRVLWAGSIPRAPSEIKKFFKVVRKYM